MPANEAITNLFIVSFSNCQFDGTFLTLICLFIGTFKSSGGNWDEDAEFVIEVKNGNRETYVCLFKKYNEKIYRYCYCLLSSRKDPEEDAKDAMYEAFKVCFENIHSLKKNCRYYLWLKQYAFKICMEMHDKYPKPPEPDNEVIIVNIPDLSTKSPVDVAINEEIQKILRGALSTLDKKYRLAIIHVHLEGHSYEEAAEIIGCKESDIKRWVHRGLLKLREILKPYKDLII